MDVFIGPFSPAMATLLAQRRFLASLAAAFGGAGAVYAFTPELAAKEKQSNKEKPAKEKLKADPEVVKKIEEAYAKLNSAEAANCQSLLKKHLTKDIVDKLKTRKTSSERPSTTASALVG